MLFFKLDGVVTNGCPDENTGSREKREKARDISIRSREFNRGLREDTFIFVSRLLDDIVTLGVIAPDPADIEKLAFSYLRAVRIESPEMNKEEITFYTLSHLLESACRQDYIDDDTEILERFGLDDLGSRFGRRVSFDEKLTECREKEKLYSDAGRFLSNETFLPELDRIYAGNGKMRASGHPVHYMIETDDRDIREGMPRILLSALYANGRLRSRRYCLLDFRPGEKFSATVYDSLYRSCDGGAMVVRYRSDDDSEGELASCGRETIETLCGAMRKYCHQVLTVFCLPRECTGSRDIFYENLGNTNIVELKEEFVYEERAKEFLKMLAADSGIRTDRELFGKIEPDKGYLAPELHDIFDSWYSWKLKTKIYPQYSGIDTVKKEVREAKPKGSAYDELMEMTGLSEAKKLIDRALKYYKAQKLFADKGMKADHPAMHMVFTGSPGTAKTTVARLFARIMKENGLLSKGNLIETGRGDLVGKYIGWTAPNIQKKFREARGSVLFIDEAYSLVDDRSGSFGDEAINTIVQEMENNREDTAVIFAGYPAEMERFLDKNPGLNSRIAFHIRFDDYDTDELCEIAGLIAKKKGLILDEGAVGKMAFVFDAARKDKDFGNGRYVRNVIEKAEMARTARLLDMDPESVTGRDVMTIRAEDIEMPEAIKADAAVGRIGFRI